MSRRKVGAAVAFGCGLVLSGVPSAWAQNATLGVEAENAVAAEVARPSLLEDANSSVDPFTSNDASAVIARPSLSKMFDSAVDFNNKEGTIGLRVSPALLVTPYPDWYLTGLSLNAAANTEETSFSVGGKWDLNFRDARFHYAFYKDRMLANANSAADACRAPDPAGLSGPELAKASAELRECRKKRIQSALLDELRDRGPIALSLGGNGSYDNDGHFGGGNATLAFDAKHTFGREAPDGYPVTLSATLNGKYEDAAPSDEEKKQLEKDGKTVGDDDRSQKMGGGLELALSVGLGGKNRNERSVELGVGAAALACLDGLCDSLDNGSSVKVNPFLGVAITKSIGGRIDVVWEGTGHSLGEAFAGASLKYSFDRPKDPPADDATPAN